MKYFTLDWWYDSCNDISVFAKYEAYLESVRSKLPPSLEKLLNREVMLHDARVRKLALQIEEEGALVIELDGIKYDRNGLEECAQSITLTYEVVRKFGLHARSGERVDGDNAFGDLGYGEFELIADGLVEHRMIFRNGVELQVQFERFALQTLDKQS